MHLSDNKVFYSTFPYTVTIGTIYTVFSDCQCFLCGKRTCLLPNVLHSVISGFRHDEDEICALLRCYAPYNGNSSPTFRDNISVPSSGVKKSKKNVARAEKSKKNFFFLGLLDP